MEETDLGIVIGTVVSAEKVHGTARLHIVNVAIGSCVVQIASGVPGDFEPGFLVGKQVPIKIDVAPITVRGIASEARFLTTSDSGKTVLLVPAVPVPDGSRVW